MFIKFILLIALLSVGPHDVQAKDNNLGWSGQGSWTTLPYSVAGLSQHTQLVHGI